MQPLLIYINLKLKQDSPSKLFFFSHQSGNAQELSFSIWDFLDVFPSKVAYLGLCTLLWKDKELLEVISEFGWQPVIQDGIQRAINVEECPNYDVYCPKDT